MIYNHADVEDIVQNTFIAFYKNLPCITSSEYVRPFLFRVTRNLSYDYLRDHYCNEQVTMYKALRRLREDTRHMIPMEMYVGMGQILSCTYAALHPSPLYIRQ